MKMKKILSLFLVVMMISSLVVANVNAASGIEFSITVPTGTMIKDSTFTVPVSITIPAESAIDGFGMKVDFDSDALELTNIATEGILTGATVTLATGRVTAAFASGDVDTAGVAAQIAVLTFKVKDVAATAPSAIEVQDDDQYISVGGVPTASTSAEGNIALARTFAVKDDGVTAITEKQSVELGTAAADVATTLGALEFDVVGDVATDTAKLKATGWTSTTYNADAAGDYEFTGTLQAVSPVTGFTTEADKTVTVTVTVGKITLTKDMVTTVVPKQNIKQDEAADPATVTTEVAMAMDDVELPDTVEICKPGTDYEETATVVWAAKDPAATIDLTKITEGENAANKVTVVGTVTPEANGNYVVTDAVTIETDIVITPAIIEGATLKLDSRSLNSVPSVTVTVPAESVKADTVNDNGTADDTTDDVVTGNNKLVVTIAGDEKTTTLEAVNITKAELVDENGNSLVYTVSEANQKKFRDLEYTNGEVVTISAKFNDADLVLGTETDPGEDPDDSADDTEVPVLSITEKLQNPVSTGGPSYTPSGSGSQGNQTGGSTGSTGGTDTPGTDAPGTDTPGTDAPVAEAPFEDVPADHWAANVIAALKDAGIVSGSGDGNFNPDADITRAEFTKMVVGLLGLTATSTEVAFEDCGAEDWFTPYVAAAVEAGLVTGVSETEFAPNETITREQAFAIIGRAMTGVEATMALNFVDIADIDEYALPYIQILVQAGIVGGYEDGTIRPDANITRAEASKVIAGLLDTLGTEEEVVDETTEEEVVDETAEEEVTEE